MTAHSSALSPGDSAIQRHAGIDRAFHWVLAASVLTLMATGLLPHVGVKFAWLQIHWLTGLLLTLIMVLHIVRAIFWQGVRSMWIGLRDFRAVKPGKYSLAQKLMHHAWTAVVLAAVATGLIMLWKVGTPFVKRNPYLLSADTWGIIYVLHDLAALLAVTLVMIHVYFGLLPEKRLYLRSMLRGSISRAELLANHDPDQWKP